MNAAPGGPNENPALEAMRTWLAPLKADIDLLDQQGPGEGRFLGVFETMGHAYDGMRLRAEEAGIQDDFERIQNEDMLLWKAMRDTFRKITPDGTNSDRSEKALTPDESVRLVAKLRIYLGKLEALLA